MKIVSPVLHALPILLLLLACRPLECQEIQPARLGFESFHIDSDSLGRIDYFVSSGGQVLDPTKKRPLVVFLQGSGPTPIAFGSGDRLGSTLLLRPSHFPECNFLVVAKPGIGFFQLTRSIESAEYDRRLSLPYRVDAVARVLDEIVGAPWVDPDRIAIIGHSEGAEVAPHAARKSPHVTHVAALAASGLSQFLELNMLVRNRCRRGEISAHEADEEIAEMDRAFRDISDHPQAVDKRWRGHSYLRWSTFAAPALDAFRKLTIPVYVAEAAQDRSTSPESAQAIRLEYVRLGKENLTYERWPTDHAFREARDGRSVDRRPDLIKQLHLWFEL